MVVSAYPPKSASRTSVPHRRSNKPGRGKGLRAGRGNAQGGFPLRCNRPPAGDTSTQGPRRAQRSRPAPNHGANPGVRCIAPLDEECPAWRVTRSSDATGGSVPVDRASVYVPAAIDVFPRRADAVVPDGRDPSRGRHARVLRETSRLARWHISVSALPPPWDVTSGRTRPSSLRDSVSADGPFKEPPARHHPRPFPPAPSPRDLRTSRRLDGEAPRTSGASTRTT